MTKQALMPLAEIADEREPGSILVHCACGFGDCPICNPDNGYDGDHYDADAAWYGELEAEETGQLLALGLNE